MRYRHVMSKTRGDKQPQCIVGVSCESHLEPVDGQPALVRLTLDRWHAHHVTYSSSGKWLTQDTTGTTADSWWRWLEACATVRGSLFLVSLGALDHWALLGLWESIEDGRIIVQKPSRPGGDTGEQEVSQVPPAQDSGGSDTGTTGVTRMRAMSNGFLVTEDTPTILYAFIRKCRSLLRWVDIRNYGIRVEEIGEGGAETARRLAEITRRMIGCLTYSCLGAIKDTAASQAMFSWRKKHLSNAVLCHTVKEVLDLESAAYFSGRCECGRIGHVEGPIYELDIRGSYTYAMAHTPVPVRLRQYTLSPARGEIPDPGSSLGWIAEVSVATEQPDYPYRHDAGTVFPTGIIRTTLCGPELYDAWEKGRILKWHKWAEYDCEPALAKFAEEVYSLRCAAEDTGDTALACWAKALAVSLVGKLGQRGRAWEWVPELKPDRWWSQYHARDKDGVVRRYQELAGNHRRERLGGWGADSVPAIAGWITSAGRLHLLSAARRCGWQHILYCDTDSLFVTEIGRQRLVAAGWIRHRELGFFQVKGVHPWMEIRGIKSYQTPTSERQTGIPRSGTSERIASNLYRVSFDTSTYLRHGRIPVAERVIRKVDSIQPYQHGNIGSDGRVTPLRILED